MRNQIINRECKICNKTIKHETSWYKHLKSKRHIKLSNNNTITTQEQHNNNTTTTQEQHNNNTITTQVSNQSEIYGECKFCDKVFKKQQSLSRHMLKYCSVKKEMEEQQRIKEELMKKDEEIKELKQIINNTTNNNTNNTNNTSHSHNNTNTNSHNTMNLDNKKINNHITINNYGKEDYSSLDKEFLKKLSLLGNNVKQKLITTLDKLYIENKSNHNVKVTNLRDSSYCEVYKEEEKWEKEKLDKVLDYRMYNSVMNIIKSINKNNEELDVNTIRKTMNNINKYQLYIEESKDIDIDKKDKKEFEYIREDHKIKLYNLNRDQEK